MPDLLGVLDQRQHRLADGVPGGLVAGDHEQQEVVVEVGGGQRLAVLGRAVDQQADQVGAVAALAFPGQGPAVLEDLQRRRRAERQMLVEIAESGSDSRMLGVVGIGVADHLVAPVDQLPGVLSGTSSSRTSTWIGKSALIFSTKSNSSCCSASIDGVLGQPAQEVLVLAGQRPLGEVARRSACAAPGGVRRRSPASTAGCPSGRRRPPRD